MSSSPFYSFSPLDKDGNPYNFKQLENKVALVVNVASKCGFTPQYTELQSLYDKFKDKGFVVIGFPCNQFMNQEPGTDEEIAKYVKDTYNVTFPILKKIEVNGNNTNDVYKYLKDQKSGVLGLKAIKWNFEKFLIDKDGNVVERYSSNTKPNEIEADIEKCLRNE
ncbi:hypothetical protein KAFR_0C02010 [Kazachstania africana CBS 2517]|uniref:Glutathione peroxidase n=1 Tax=Kazachstania africana (strain ATCC 22294 / BCRC 22015 / CBS 2517 / CECT 1963 / NBRC 1671 / NRRL Y-8276) TaxID=1071382 RepID=H2AS44_KAZAF|nr:hypothetical protein KAFR_0C02010 [Kazachstania africana CBS 2517]CCF57194.1 hypothetical protein KAFR_0C02010 [Kazachstania africana CBS 2517]